ncbi:unnamed protein product [Paramecium pentaurelia]|uniref:Uncharacterized protein n=1 Tax=Paramecium pentaurelia TaxID=43138 RepID=A0A8S1S0R9_9CILI|nr:unnamed protein product [Paramecium pentaurelia]
MQEKQQKQQQQEQKKSEFYIGKFFCQFQCNGKMTGKNQLKVKLKIFDQKKTIKQLKKKKLYVVSNDIDQYEYNRIVCKVKKGKEIVKKIYNNHGKILHLYDEIWFFLLNAGYVKLRVKIIKLNESDVEIAEVSVYLTQQAIDDDYEMKINRYNKKTEKLNNVEENQMELLKYARLSLLLMFDFMNVTVEENCLIKQNKQFKIFFAQYCQFFQKSKMNFQVKSLLKPYARPIIEKQQVFENYLNSKRFNNNLFEKKLIQDLVVYQTGPSTFVSQYKKQYSPKMEEIYPIHHDLFQRIGLEFFQYVKAFIKRSKNSVDNQFAEIYDDYVLRTVFLCTCEISEKIQKDSIYTNQHKNLIKVRKQITEALSRSNKDQLNLLSDKNLKIYQYTKNTIHDLYFIDFKINRRSIQQYQQVFSQFFQPRFYYQYNNQGYSEMEKYIQKQIFEEIKEQIKYQKTNLEQNKQDINDIFLINNLILKEYNTPKLMISELKKHQKEALFWMLYREGHINDHQLQQKQQLSPLWQEYKLQGGESLYVNMFTGKVSKEKVTIQETKGGILADEMGLGKTLMALALILETLKSEQQTLIVVPKSVIKQWEKEIFKHSKPESLKVLVYYKKKDRKNKKTDFKNFNIILTTYAVLSMDFQIWNQINNINIEQDGHIDESDSFVERVQSIEEYSELSNTMDIYDSSSDDDDNQQSQFYNNPFYEYQNEKRKQERQLKQQLKQKQKQEMQEKQKKKRQLNPQQLEIAKEHNNLFKQKYHRVILDEAHNIKFRQTLQSKSAYSLEADFRWCLTGTPMQNKHDDLFSLLQFLRVETFSEYFWWNTYINKEENEEDQQRILSQILQPIILRRTKNSQRFDGLNQVDEEICWVELNEKEQILYQKLLAGSQDIFKHFTIDKNNKSYVHIFQIINKLKLACNHPQLALKEINLDKTPIEEVIDKINQFFSNKQKSTNMTEVYKKSLVENIRNGDVQECEICTNTQIDTFCLSSCGHIFCKKCFTQAINQQQICPVCRTTLSITDLIEIKVENENDFEDLKTLKFGLSSKLVSILNKTKIVQQQKEKVLIFTQSIDMIQLIDNLFQDNGIIAYRITGQMSVDKREKIIKQFKDSLDAIALLLSLRATSTGLNLTMANNVFLVDPWWNPAIEDQAIGRADRIGQLNQVKVVRFLCRNTIEQSINLLHQQKRFQNKRAFSGEAKKAQELQDFKFILFQQ